MKKIISSFVAILGIFTFSACSLFGPSDESTSLTGVLAEQESNDGYPGTHLVTDANGGIHAVSSTTIALSSQQYLGNQVTVSGKLDEGSGIFMVSGVSVDKILDKPTGKANWVTYMNQELGFKWKYYDNWVVSDKDNYVTFTAPDQSISVVLEKNDEGLALNEFVNKYLKDNSKSENAIITDVKIGLEQYTAKKVMHQAPQSFTENDYNYFVARDKFVLMFVYTPAIVTASENTFNEMLSEFTFVPMTDAQETTLTDTPLADTPLTDTPSVDETSSTVPSVPAVSADYSNFSDFESGPYFFSAKYPKGWYYSGEKGQEDGVLHVYKFSNEKMDDATTPNILAVLKVLSTTELPTGSKITLGNGIGVKQTNLGDVYVYVKVGDRVYSVQGSQELSDVLEKIAGSIQDIKNP